MDDVARVRRNVWTLPPADQTLVWYGRAVRAMQNRPLRDPTSWRFQAAIHAYNRRADPLAVQGEALPSADIRRRFWTQCQHGSWFFLPWHRMYLAFFEQIVAADVANLGGPEDWALPYWNYSATEQSRLLPPAFRNRTLGDGSRNYLYVDRRDPACNAGRQFADERDVAVRTALTQANFSDPARGNFGGLPSNFSHRGPGRGAVEGVPHGSLHSAVGGQNGWMGGFATAALDPIFWLHHANIDRLWQVWVDRDAGHRNPTSLQWLSMIAFSFFNAARRQVTLRCSDVVDTAALNYTYDDVSDPVAAPALAAASAPAAGETEEPMPDAMPPELIGATEASFRVANAAARIRIPTPAHAAARRRRAALAAPDAPDAPATVEPRVLLQLENLTARGRANTYDVYVNLPDGADFTQHPERFAGRLDLFGVAEASRTSDQHLGTGLTYTLDISAIYRQLSTAADWDPENIDVSLVPVRSWEGATVTVGRVSVFFG